ncbi:neutrophil cytosol factor 1 isoform X1 [Scophthalmus maximus]|uniref:neutrophil cytosol factor 1 isoform X1 n=1 Tax=Scophthalmus maximus TaxID=52904 RepID=UPI0015E06F40|nr:neutrophil cytosol factor 1 isoform X1 [Scophthalmus maximus]
MEQIYVRHVELLGFEKRDFPTQHYPPVQVYMLMVKWSDLGEKLVYRTYPEIHTLHKSLKEMFPIEAGRIEKRDRVIPSLPAPRWVDSQKSTETRQSTLADYCHSLINLPPHISRCTLLTNFFKVRPEDENPPAPNTQKRNETFVVSRELDRGKASEISGPIILDTYRVIADFSRTSKHEIELRTGDLVEIVEKNQNGWWFCECDGKRGWVPASYLEPLDQPDETEDAEPNYEGEMFITTNAYKAEQEDEISLEMGEIIEVIHKLLDGWWVVRKGEETGHFPSMYLQKAGNRETQAAAARRTNPQGQKPPPRRSTIRNAKSIHDRSRQRLSQDAYRRNSRRYLQQKGGRRLNEPHSNSKSAAKSPLKERKNQDNIPEPSGSSSESEVKRETPVVPPRPSPELILERCTDNTRKRVSINKLRPNN